MATNGALEQSDAAPQGGRPSGVGFTISGKLLFISVVALLVMGVVGCSESNGAGNGNSGGNSGSSQSTESRSEWIDECAQRFTSRASRYWRPDEREQREADTEDLCECMNVYVTEYWGPDPPLFSSLKLHSPIIRRYELERRIEIESGRLAEPDEVEQLYQQMLAERRTSKEYLDIYNHAASYCLEQGHRIVR